MAKKILITGGTGFLGVHLARYFIQKGLSVTLLDTSPLDAKDLIGKVKVEKCDIRNKRRVFEISEKQDYIVHAAAAHPDYFKKRAIFTVNIDGTRNVLEAALKNKAKRVVFISSTAVYGVPKHVPERENSPLDPIGYYGKSKVKGEKLCLEYRKKGLEINILRPKTFLGPERLGVFELWFEAIFMNHRVYILGNGRNKFQLLAVSDLVEAIDKALFCRKSGEVFNIGAKEFGTWRSDLGYILSHTRSGSKILSLPTLPCQIILGLLELFNLSPLTAWDYKTLPVNSYVSIEKAERILDWHPKKSNKQLFLESFLWYKNNRNEVKGQIGKNHRTGRDFKVLKFVSKFL